VRLRRIADSLTYANVVATLALFIALGGASYAVVALPPRSVGARQLRARAVAPSALTFPVGVADVTDRRREDITKGPCNGKVAPGTVIGVACPLRLRSGISTPGREVHFSLRSAGRLLLASVVGLADEGPPGAKAVISLSLILDGRSVQSSDVDLSGGDVEQIPMQIPVDVAAGAHRVGLTANAYYDYYQPGDVIVSPVSLAVTAAPRL